MFNKSIRFCTIIGVAIFTIFTNAFAEPLRITGSSTVAPFAKALALNLSQQGLISPANLQITGTGKGLKIFCSTQTSADITGASRRAKFKEIKACEQNNIKTYEIMFGFDGIVIASALGNRMQILNEDLFLALAKEVPNKNGTELIPNPYRYWNEINSNLPHRKIIIYGGSKGSGTRDTIEHTLMNQVSERTPAYHEQSYHQFRTDGAYIDDKENHAQAIAELKKNPEALAFFGYSYYIEHQTDIAPIAIDGIQPNQQTIATMKYPLARPLYVYLKRAAYEANPDVQTFIQALISDEVAASGGLLSTRGLIPLPESMLHLYPLLLEHKVTFSSGHLR